MGSDQLFVMLISLVVLIGISFIDLALLPVMKIVFPRSSSVMLVICMEDLLFIIFKDLPLFIVKGVAF